MVERTLIFFPSQLKLIEHRFNQLQSTILPALITPISATKTSLAYCEWNLSITEA